jgi:site-specific DNA-methyltransferase (adenine-specific)
MIKENKLLLGDCLDKLKELEDNSIDSIVSDPPYGLAFMGKKWDYDVPSQAIWEECMRVLKPGGHLLSFAGSRTYHRMAVRIEDAGFEIRDQIMWIYGSGFPKSHNVGNAIDKKHGAGNRGHAISSGNQLHPTTGLARPNGEKLDKYEARTEEGKGWEGWGTALKPAHEPIVMARKPIVGTVANNVLEYGVGGINIDGCRIGNEKVSSHHAPKGTFAGGDYDRRSDTNYYEAEGRFPANIILDEEAGQILDEQSGERGNGWKKNYGVTDYNGKQYDSSTQQCIFGGGFTGKNTYADSGGASRFFYCPKANKKDRDEGVEVEAKAIKGRDEGQDKMAVAYKARPTERQNIHPTVKPTDLMQYLIRLVTPKGGVVLDPFMGSGSTGKAAIKEGMIFVGIEREDEYYQIAKQRIGYEINKNEPKHNFW